MSCLPELGGGAGKRFAPEPIPVPFAVPVPVPIPDPAPPLDPVEAPLVNRFGRMSPRPVRVSAGYRPLFVPAEGQFQVSCVLDVPEVPLDPEVPLVPDVPEVEPCTDPRPELLVPPFVFAPMFAPPPLTVLPVLAPPPATAPPATSVAAERSPDDRTMPFSEVNVLVPGTLDLELLLLLFP